jgi:hypothetical protein
MDAGTLSILLIFAMPTLAVATGLYLLVRILSELQLLRRDLRTVNQGASQTDTEGQVAV